MRWCAGGPMVVIIDYVLDVLGIQMDIVNVEETLL